MQIDAWLQAAVADAGRRGLPGIIPLLHQLARATETLRSAPFESAGAAPERAATAPDAASVGGAGESGPEA